MKESKWSLASNSLPKQLLVKKIGGEVIKDELLLEKIQKAEDDFHAVLVDGLGLPDGLIVPYFIPYGDGKVALPVVVTKVKAEAVKQFISENPTRIDAEVIVVNDSIWAIDGKHGALSVAINKTDPQRNSGDVERLSSFFRNNAGRNFYSVGCNCAIETKDCYYAVSIGRLRVGRIQELKETRIQEILSVELKKTGAFDLRFIIKEGLVVGDEALDRLDEDYEEFHIRAHGLNMLGL